MSSATPERALEEKGKHHEGSTISRVWRPRGFPVRGCPGAEDPGRRGSGAGQACALNHLDFWLRRGVRAWKLPCRTLWAAISRVRWRKWGVVTRVKPGDRVLLWPGISCGQCEACSKGLDSACRLHDIRRHCRWRLRGICQFSGGERDSHSGDLNFEKPPLYRWSSSRLAHALDPGGIEAWRRGAGHRRRFGRGQRGNSGGELVNARVIATAGTDGSSRAHAYGRGRRDQPHPAVDCR